MTSFWILLFIICLPKTGSTGENPSDHGHYTHDAVIISRFHDAHHLWRQGHQTFSGFIKARERPGKRGGEKDFGGRKKPEKQRQKKEARTRGKKEARTQTKTRGFWGTENKREGHEPVGRTLKTREENRRILGMKIQNRKTEAEPE
jgi:hypothetical protein